MSEGLDEETALEPFVGREGVVYEETVDGALVTALFVGSRVPKTVVAREMDVVVVPARAVDGGVVQAIRAAERATLTPANDAEDVERLAAALDADRRVRDRYDASVDDLDRLERGDEMDVPNSNVAVTWIGDEDVDVGAVVEGSTETFLHVEAQVDVDRVRTALDDAGVDLGTARVVEPGRWTEVDLDTETDLQIVGGHAETEREDGG